MTRRCVCTCVRALHGKGCSPSVKQRGETDASVWRRWRGGSGGVGGVIPPDTDLRWGFCSHNQATLLQLIQSYWHALTQQPRPPPSHIVHVLLLLIFSCLLKHWDLFGDRSHMTLNGLFSPTASPQSKHWYVSWIKLYMCFNACSNWKGYASTKSWRKLWK